LAKNNKIAAIGEIGLDYYYDYSPKNKQIEAFKSQIELVLKLNLPILK
jgi:TatD DNase family protein